MAIKPQVPKAAIQQYKRTTGLALGSRPNILVKLERQLQNKVIGEQQARNRMRKANQDAVYWLVNHSSEVLERRIKATNRDQESPENLVRVVANADLNSTWNADGFQWFRSSKVNRTNVRRYWRVIEEGSRYWVNRSRETGEGLIFRGSRFDGTGATRGGAGGRFRSTGFDRTAGTSAVNVVRPFANGKPRGALIRNPIPAYHYLEETQRAFGANSRAGVPAEYRRIVRDAFAGTAIKF